MHGISLGARSMAEFGICARCNNELPAISPTRLCPACLLRQGTQYEPLGVLERHVPELAVQPTNSMVARAVVSTMGGAAISGAWSDAPDTVTPDEASTGADTTREVVSLRYFGDYELTDVLGKGAMGVVYCARQISLDRPVAIKMIRAAALADEDDRRRFQNEAEAVAKLDHPHIVPIYEVGEHDGQRYFSMKLIGGPCLQQAVPAFAANPTAAARLVITIAGAVHHAHQRGILHRDLKPSNILLDEQGQPHVSDFGLAKRLEGDGGLTVSGLVVGTPAYMAPEQASGKKRLVTTLSDVYGLGAILYTLLTSNPPFRGDSVFETLDQVRKLAPTAPSRINRKVHRDIDVICLKCLEKDPARRYASAQALADDLGSFLAGKPIHARPASALETSWLWCRRNPWLTGAAAATTAALSAVFVFALLYAQQQSTIAVREQQIAGEQRKATAAIKGLATNLKSSLDESHRNLAGLYFERGQSACEKGDIGSGLVLLAQSYHWAVEAGDKGWRHTALASLSAWQRLEPTPRAIFSARRVSAVAVSPDGKTVLIAGGEHAAQLWEISTGRPVGSPLTHQQLVHRVAFSPDGKTLLTASFDSTARLWDASTGQPLGPPLKHAKVVADAVFSPDGKSVLTGSEDSTVRLWRVPGGQPLITPILHQKLVHAVAFSPDGKTLLTGSADNTARLWDAANGQPIGVPMPHEGQVWQVVFSPDGKTVLTGELFGKNARLWHAATGRSVGTPLRHEGTRTRGAFSPDGKIVLTGSDDGMARLWDAANGQPLGVPITHQDGLRPVAFSPDGNSLLMAIGDRSAQLWDVATRQPVGRPMTHLNRGGPRAFSPDGKMVITSSSDGTTRLWDSATGDQLSQPLPHRGPVLAVAFSSDGKTVLTGGRDKTARLWDAATGHALGSPLAHDGDVKAVAISPDGKTLLTGCGDKAARLWDAATGHSIGCPLFHPRSVCAVAFSPDGKTVLTGSEDRTARFWNASTGQAVGRPMTHEHFVSAVAFSPDGKTVLTGSLDTTARLWDSSTGQPIGAPIEHELQVSAVAFSPDGKTVLTGSRDKTARLWDASTGEPLGPPLPHQGPVSAVAFSPDGSTVLTASHDKTARLWDRSTGRPLGPPLTHQDWVNAAAFSPDGKTVLTGCGDHTARLWDVSVLPDDPERIASWIEVVTGLGLDRQGAVTVLDGATWRLRRNKLESARERPAVSSPTAAPSSRLNHATLD